MRLKKPIDGEIIIKRRSRRGHNDTHGGAWKVAFADFTLAMMALFMVLWIIQPQRVSETTAAEALINPILEGGAGVFDGTSKTPLDLDGIPIKKNKDELEKQKKENLAEIEKSIKEGYSLSLQQLALLMNTLSVELNAQTNLAIDIVPQGLRILIKDDEHQFMFERGSAKINPKLTHILEKLAKAVNNVENKLIISGHTDATQYRLDKGYNNWNLSGDRALVARNVLVNGGLKEDKVLQVTAQADTKPLNKEQPEDGENRRIELLVLTKQAETLYDEIFGKQSVITDADL